ncbi:MAG: phosphoribosylformylglycinamidine cyclo-ligase [Candidatus Hodarchaeota archaeon]
MIDIHILAGSTSDQDIVKKITAVLIKQKKVKYKFDISSAHREPDRTRELIRKSTARVFICVAGLSAALPGFVASLTNRPVIGVPTSAGLGGLDALLSIVQMPKGIPVATVGIDNGANAAYLALRILGLENSSLERPRTYAEAGVDLSKEKDDLAILGEWTQKTFEFGNVFADFGHYCNIIEFGDLLLALTTDGVGTKLLVAEEFGDYSTIGIDCLAMNVNDLLAMNIEPLAFVDYIATDSPLGYRAEEIAKGLYEGCKIAKIPLLGGETATVPEMVKGFDLAGAAMGVCQKEKLITGSKIQPGDAILGISSSGLHSNGYTLARKILLSEYSLMDDFRNGKTVGQELLIPTRIYRKEIEALQSLNLHGLAHITGGAYTKLKRLTSYNMLFDNFPLNINFVFKEIQRIGEITAAEMFRTFNMGFGFIVILPENQVAKAFDLLEDGETVCQHIGTVLSEKEGKISFPAYGVEFHGD